MAIGACVLGNTIMGLVITINGRMGATVGCVYLQRAEPSLPELASHSVPCPRTHAIWLLLQLLRCRVSLCPCHCLARVSFFDQSLPCLRMLISQCPNHDWRPMHDGLAHGNLAKLCQYPKSHTR